MTLSIQKSVALTAALFAVPMMLGMTTAHAGSKSKFGIWLNYGDNNHEDRSERYDRNNDDYNNVDDSETNQSVYPIGYRNHRRGRKTKICKRSVVGIGYGTSKSLARANAVQAWARESRKRYGRTYRLRDANLISDIRCQYNGNDRRYSRRSKSRRKFYLPGEAGNPNHNWNCTVNAKPCRTKNVATDPYTGGSRWKRRFCRDYARKATRQQRRNIRLGCEYRGPKWHRNYRRHVRQCMRTPMYKNFRVMWRHQRRLRQCR